MSVRVSLPCASCGQSGAAKYRTICLGGLLFECIPPVCHDCWVRGAGELMEAVRAAAPKNTPKEAPRFWVLGVPR